MIRRRKEIIKDHKKAKERVDQGLSEGEGLS